ncbi:MAG TPA: M20/M25/M40 family metallo-hydrolase [Thermoanaerobaculia bacterium]|nr:M20/M25/M40 family metallo-hydrolase [Thermoanaerobaculia bacterium]
MRPASASSITSITGPGGLLESLVAIPSVTGNEAAVIDFVEERLRRGGWMCESIPVSPERRNLYAHRGDPRVVLSTHADTVPPHLPPRREGTVLFGRGACDAKGSLAAMVHALETLPAASLPSAGLLLVVGEERGSDGALAANAHPQSVRYLVGGEPTGNRFVAGSKGCLRVAIETRGVAAHSSLQGEAAARSAVDPLLEILSKLRALAFADDAVFGSSTMNIGVVEAGTAPNVVAERGRAEVLFRTGVPVDRVLEAVRAASLDSGAEVTVPYRSEPTIFRVPRGEKGEIVAFACDLPLLTAWGEPILLGPGSIGHAHAADERVDLAQVEQAARIYRDLAEGLVARGEDALEPAPGARQPPR